MEFSAATLAAVISASGKDLFLVDTAKSPSKLAASHDIEDGAVADGQGNDKKMRTAGPIPPPYSPMPWQLHEIYRASRDKSVDVINHETSLVQEETVTLAREDDATRKQVYRGLPGRGAILLGVGHKPRGELFFGVMLRRVAGNQELYQEPNENDARLVVIKKIRLDRVGSNENPFHEISAMQALGDYKHVMGCIEALSDNDHLYIVMPWMRGGDLHNRIPQLGLPEPEARAIFKSIVSNVEYLHRNHACHRDLKPQNILMINNKTSTLLTDMAMSRRIPVSPHGVAMVPLGTCGSLPFMPPEIFENRTFDGFKVDIWSLGITLFFTLTGQLLYKVPHEDDTVYKHFITHRGLDPNNDGINTSLTNYANGLQERFQNMAEDALREECSNHKIRSTGEKAELIARLELAHHWLGPMVEKIQVVQNLSQLARHLLNGMLNANPTKRITLEEVRQHPWLDQLEA